MHILFDKLPVFQYANFILKEIKYDMLHSGLARTETCLIFADRDGVLSAPLSENTVANYKINMFLTLSLHLPSFKRPFNVQPMFKVEGRHF